MRHLPGILAILCVFAFPTVYAQKTLAIVGSSTSACSGPSTYDSCYVARLQKYYEHQSPFDTLINNGYAVPGYSCLRGMPTSFVSPYADPNLKPDPAHNITAALSIHPDVVLVNYPTNSYDTLRIDTILYCLRTIRDSANAKGVPCYVTTTQPRNTFTLAQRTKLKELRDSILLEFGYFAINFWDGLADPVDYTILPAYNADNIHLNDAGHNILFQRVVAKNIFNVALPASFVQFNASVKNGVNLVSWTTTHETDVNYFEVQRSADGAAFSRIGTVSARNTAGDNQYQFADAQPLKGANYYKVVIVDKDGKTHASAIMTVRSSAGRPGIGRIVANSGSQLLVEILSSEPQQAELHILNSTGMLLAKTSRRVEAGSTSILLDLPSLSNGVYYVKLVTPLQTATKSFIKN